MSQENGLESGERRDSLPSTRKEWQTFERKFGAWLRENAYTITEDEGRSFKSATYDCLGLGISAGVATDFLLAKVNMIKKPVTRHLFSAFAGSYATAICMRYKCRQLYTTILNSPGRVGDAARSIAMKTKEPNSTTLKSTSDTGDNYYRLYEPTMDSQNSTNHYTSSNAEFRREEENSFSLGDTPNYNLPDDKTPQRNKAYKTWEDIRKEKQGA